MEPIIRKKKNRGKKHVNKRKYIKLSLIGMNPKQAREREAAAAIAAADATAELVRLAAATNSANLTMVTPVVDLAEFDPSDNPEPGTSKMASGMSNVEVSQTRSWLECPGSGIGDENANDGGSVVSGVVMANLP